MVALVVVSVARLIVLGVAVTSILAFIWYITKLHFETRHPHVAFNLLSGMATSVFAVLAPFIVLTRLLAWTFDGIDKPFFCSFMLLWLIPALAISLRNRAKYKASGVIAQGGDHA